MEYKSELKKRKKQFVTFPEGAGIFAEHEMQQFY